MTRTHDSSGREVLKLGTVERWVVSLVALAFVAVVGYLVTLTLKNHEALSEANTRMALMEQRLATIEGQLKAVRVGWEGM